MPARIYRLAVIIPQFTVSVKGTVLFADSKIFHNCDCCLEEMNTKIWVYLLIICPVYLERINGNCGRSYQQKYLFHRKIYCYEVVCSYEYNANSYQAKSSYSVCYNIVISSSDIFHFSSTTIKADDPVYYLKIQDSSLSMIEQGAFQSQIFSDLQEIHFLNNKLSKIESGVFKSLSYLKVLNLTQNLIETIQDNAFDFLERLASLDLSKNRLKQIGLKYFVGLPNLNLLLLHENNFGFIEANAFISLNQLSKLNLEDFQIKKLVKNTFAGLTNVNKLLLPKHSIHEIEAKAFSGLENLQLLDLSQQKLTKLLVNTFDGMRRLEELDLGDNNITYIENGAFNGLENLKKLNISDFLITVVKTNAFAGLTNVKDLLLPKHSIHEIEEKAFSGLKSLQELDLSLQNFTQIVSNTFIGLSSLKILTLTKNAVDNIQASAFNGTQLNHIDFSLNALSVIATNFTRDLQTIVAANFSFNLIKILEVDNFDDFMKLAILDLSHNIIETLPVGYFGHLNSLKRLDLSHNHITTLEVGTFVGLVGLEFLDLSNNKVVTMPTIVFHNTPQLSSLDVSDNLITALDPLKLKKFTKLRTINVDNNFFDCHTLSEIIEQLRSLGVEMVYGTTKKLTGIHGVICRADKNTSLINNVTSNPLTFTTGNETNVTGQLFKYLEEIAELLKEAVQESFNTTRMLKIQQLKDVEDKIKEAPVKESMHFQSLNQNNDNDFVKLNNATTSYNGIIQTLILVCLLGILILLTAKYFGKINVFRKRFFLNVAVVLKSK